MLQTIFIIIYSCLLWWCLQNHSIHFEACGTCFILKHGIWLVWSWSRPLSASSQINSRDVSGQTPLHLACEKGDLVCVKELLEESQARTDIKDRNGDTPMHCASKQDSPVIIQVRLYWKEVSVKSLSVFYNLVHYKQNATFRNKPD